MKILGHSSIDIHLSCRVSALHRSNFKIDELSTRDKGDYIYVQDRAPMPGSLKALLQPGGLLFAPPPVRIQNVYLALPRSKLSLPLLGAGF
jgi:hypothetical protein